MHILVEGSKLKADILRNRILVYTCGSHGNELVQRISDLNRYKKAYDRGAKQPERVSSQSWQGQSDPGIQQ